MMRRWNPWRALRAWGELVDFAFAPLPDGVDGRSYPLPEGRAGLELDHDLDQVERRATLGHELVHIERRIWFPPAAPPGLVAKEEEIVDRELARRLVPLDELALFAASMAQFEPITTAMVAEEFEVPHAVAYRALWLLGQQRGTAA